MDEPDIYGDDIYGDAGPAFNDDLQDQQPAQAAPAKAAAGNHALPAGPYSEAELRAQLQQAHTVLDAWRAAFPPEGPPGAPAPAPAAAAASLRRAREDADAAHAQLQAANARAAGLEFALAEKSLEAVQLRRSLHKARQAADPSIVQVRQLLLDPAVNREFSRLRAELEDKAREAKALQQELQAVNFSQESKTGRMLMAKCRTLQDENEEMGRELAEGKVHGLERGAALAKGYADDLRRAYVALEDHSHALDRENEDLQGQVFLLRRQLRDLESQQEAAGRPAHRAPPPPDAGGFAPGGSRKRPASSAPRDSRDAGYSRDGGGYSRDGGFGDSRGRPR